MNQLTRCPKARPLGCGECRQVWFQGFTRLGRYTNEHPDLGLEVGYLSGMLVFGASLDWVGT